MRRHQASALPPIHSLLEPSFLSLLTVSERTDGACRLKRAPGVVRALFVGHSTYFDAPPEWKKTFKRGFGDLHGNACGYVIKGAGVESITDLPFPIDTVAAISDFDGRGLHSSTFQLNLSRF